MNEINYHVLTNNVANDYKKLIKDLKDENGYGINSDLCNLKSYFSELYEYFVKNHYVSAPLDMIFNDAITVLPYIMKDKSSNYRQIPHLNIIISNQMAAVLRDFEIMDYEDKNVIGQTVAQATRRINSQLRYDLVQLYAKTIKPDHKQYMSEVINKINEMQ